MRGCARSFFFIANSLEILYEDESLLFVNKPPDIVVQRGFDETEPILFDIAQQYTSPLFLMQRLDRGTSGVMFFSKQARMNRALTRFFERKRIHKRYLAICEGEIAEKQTIDAPLVRIGAIKFAVEGTMSTMTSRRAVTHVAPISSNTSASLLSVHLETGRTHQIRVHLTHLGFPLAGDDKYGDFAWNKVLSKHGLKRMFLHARRIRFVHPVDGREIVIESPLAPDLAQFVARLDSGSAGARDD